MREFEVGDYLELLNDSYATAFNGPSKGDVIPVVFHLPDEDSGYWISKNGAKVRDLNTNFKSWASKDFKLVDCPIHFQQDQKEVIIPISRNVSDIARPILSERKVGKVRMELFDDGFPNAIYEIGKVLTWAQTAKGYLDHDWQNLPDPENGFKGAASRHRIKTNIQKAQGIAAIERVDEESKIHHLAHQATNILMELEMILTGKIK